MVSRRRRSGAEEDQELRGLVSAPLVEQNGLDGRGNGGTNTVPPMKRRKELVAVNHPMQMGFSRGNILSLKMGNVMTFGAVELRPGPRLNMIIGPNGAGKSTIVNALCLVFGGNLKILGRSSQLGSYIKHGETQAFVEAVLCDDQVPTGARSIKREFTKDRNVWSIDGEPSTKGEIDKMRAQYDIQLDNLTQFLPQEKIAQFTELSESDLLKSTMSALGGTERVEKYDELLNDHMRLQHMVNKSAFDEKQLEDLKAKNKGIEPDVALFHERQQILNNIKLMEMLRPWVEFEVHREEVQGFKETAIKVDRELKQMKELYNTEMAPLRQKEEQLEAHSEKISATHKQVARWDKKLTKSLEQCEEIAAQFDTARDAYNSVDGRIQERREKIRDMEVEIEKLEEKMQSYGDQSKPKERMNDTKREKLEISTLLSNVSEESADERRRRREIEHEISVGEQKLKRLDDKKTRKLEMITREHYDLHRALHFIQENHDRFRGPVVGPIALEVNTESRYHARVLGACVPKWLQYAFLVETAEDQSLLSRTISEQRWDVNCVTAPSPSARFDPVSIDHLRAFGIYSTVLDCFDASENIKRLLAAHCSLHNIVIGDQNSTRNTDAISRSGVQSFFTPEANYSVRRSRYGDHVSSRSQPLPDHGGDVFMGVADNDAERQSITWSLEELQMQRNASLQREHSILERQKDLHAKLGEIDQTFISLRRNLEVVNKTEQAIRSRQNALKSLRQESSTERAEEEKQKLLDDMRSLEASSREKHEIVFESTMAQVQLFTELDRAVAQQGDFTREVDKLTQKGRELDSQIQAKREETQNLKDQLRDEVRKLHELSEKAKKACPNPSDYKEQWDSFPQELDELDTEIRTERARADTIMGISPDLIEEYRRRQQQIEELEKRVSNNTQVVEDKRANLETARADFSQWLRGKVSHMSERFTSLYQQIGCAGELKLYDEEIDKIRLEIHVSYRNNMEMRVLSGQTHSGGERMVATMLYHFALQDLTPAPFRVVDEMNQGMDPVFERKILDIMLRDAREGASPQCFLITPKLLLDLSYNENTVTHIILNGDIDQNAYISMHFR